MTDAFPTPLTLRRVSDRFRVSRRLATLRQGSARPDLFLVHAAGADAFAYVPLVRCIASDVAVHVFQNPYRFFGEGMYACVEDMASDYVAILQQHQPRGPYRLGGWSLGGSVAFEMANQLLATGHEVSGLVLFDTRPPSLSERVSAGLRRVLSRWRDAGVPDGTAASIRHRAQIFAAEHRIERAYSPRWVYPRTMTLFVARGSEASSSAWQRFTSRPLDLHELEPSEGHASMMREENVALYAGELESFLERTRIR